jgi:imidazolonepropionase-like amidohydrolase
MKKNRRTGLASAAVIAAGVILASSILFSQQESAVYVRVGKIYTSDNGRVVAGGGILIKDGKFVKVDEKAKPPKNAQVIDLSDQTVIPGLIDAFSHMGFRQEDFNVRTEPPPPWRAPLEGVYRLYFGAAEQKSPPPRVEARFKASDAVFYNDASFRRFLAEGIIMAAIAIPTDGLSGGMTFVAKLDPSSSSDFVLVDPGGAVFSLAGDENVMRRYGDLKKTFLDARDYRKTWEKYQMDLKKYQEQQKRKKGEGTPGEKAKKEEPEEKEVSEPKEPKENENHEAVLQVLDRKMPAFIRASRINEIEAALKLQEEFKIRLVLVGGQEGYKIHRDLASRKVGVIAGPEAVLDRKGKKVNYIRDLLAGGIPVAFGSASSAGGVFLSYQLAYAVQHDLSRIQALDTVTTHAASILGLEASRGRIAAGRDADFVVLDGEPFDLGTRVRRVYRGGKMLYSED